ncbi:MAG TPA: hypothetical protein VNW29_04995 [Candidatus Sulfotelmatobacter sp.]|jgi:hypothetical protein|nr:hypothetical protein [Candidatus Sulfotelmatobacter sp.]
MHNFFAGLMGFFMGFGSFFHGGHGLPIHVNQTQSTQQATASGTPDSSSSGMMERGFGHGKGMNLPIGQRPFFGTVTTVNGSKITVQMVMLGRGFRMNQSVTPTITLGTTQIITITLDSFTKYVGGSQSDIAVNTKIAGVGKLNSDGSITATQIRINATMPSSNGFWHGQGKPDDNGHNRNQ